MARKRPGVGGDGRVQLCRVCSTTAARRIGWRATVEALVTGYPQSLFPNSSTPFGARSAARGAGRGLLTLTRHRGHRAGHEYEQGHVCVCIRSPCLLAGDACSSPHRQASKMKRGGALPCRYEREASFAFAVGRAHGTDLAGCPKKSSLKTTSACDDNL